MQQVLYFVLDMIAPLLTGYLLRRSPVKPHVLDKLMTINITIIFPILCILSFWVIHLDLQLIWLPILGIVMQVVPGVFGWWRARSKFEHPLEQGSYIMACLLSNRTILGTLGVYILLGEKGYALAQLVVLLETFVTFTVAFPVASYFSHLNKEGKAWKVSFQTLLINRNQLSLLGIFIGAMLNLSGLARPPMLDHVFPLFIHFNAWSALLPIGYLIDVAKMRKYWPKIKDLAWIKFLLIPICMFPLSYFIIRDPTAILVLTILSFAPTAVFSVVAAKLNNLDIDLALAAFVYTTLMYFVLVYPLTAMVTFLIRP